MVPQYYVCIKSQKVDTSITYMIECIQGLMPKKKNQQKISCATIGSVLI